MTGTSRAATRPRAGLRAAQGVLIGLLLTVGATGCGGADKDHPGISAAATASAAAAEFSAAHGTFLKEFKAAAELTPGEEGTLAQRTSGLRAVRESYEHFLAAVRKIDLPDRATEDVDAMYTAIEALVDQFEVQGTTTTAASFRSENADTATAFEAADQAIMKVRTVLGVDAIEAG